MVGRGHTVAYRLAPPLVAYSCRCDIGVKREEYLHCGSQFSCCNEGERLVIVEDTGMVTIEEQLFRRPHAIVETVAGESKMLNTYDQICTC